MSQLKMEPKLSLNKTTISRLSNTELSAVKGGFTYSLSTGAVCQESNAKWDALVEQNTTNPPQVYYVDGNTVGHIEDMHKPRNGYECSAL